MSEETPTFEQAVKRLSDIAQALERGDVTLEESLRLLEAGFMLSRAPQDEARPSGEARRSAPLRARQPAHPATRYDHGVARH